jgi:hypothetical protein
MRFQLHQNPEKSAQILAFLGPAVVARTGTCQRGASSSLVMVLSYRQLPTPTDPTSKPRVQRADGLTLLLFFVALIAGVHLAWCLTPSNNNPFVLFSAAVSIVTIGLVPFAWNMKPLALGGLAFIHLCVGVLNVYRFWEDHDRTLRLFIVVPFAIAWSLWLIRRKALTDPT